VRIRADTLLTFAPRRNKNERFIRRSNFVFLPEIKVLLGYPLYTLTRMLNRGVGSLFNLDEQRWYATFARHYVFLLKFENRARLAPKSASFQFTLST